jgi:hypothetical protein
MTARIVWKRRQSVRGIEKRARRTADPLERLRYVRNQMDSWELPDAFRWWPVRRIVAWISVAIVVALLVWRIR